MFHVLSQQRTVHHISHVRDVGEGQSLDVAWVDVFHILTVALAEDDLFDAGPLGCKDLFLDAAHGKHLSTQGDFAAHRQVLAHLSLGEGAGQRGEHGDASAWAVLGNRALGNVNVDVPLVKHVGRQAEPIGVGLQMLQGDDGRLFHDVAEVAGQRQLARARRQRRLDEQDVASTRRPSEPGDDPRHLVAFVPVFGSGDSEDVVQVFCTDLDVVGLFEGDLFGAVTHNFGESLVQPAYATLVGVLFHHRLDGCHRHFQVRFREARFVEVLGEEVALADLDFLFHGVAADVDDFHAVAQRGLNGAQVVARGEEHDLAQVVIEVEVVVVEGVVLLGVEDFEQGRGGVSVVVAAELVETSDTGSTVGASASTESASDDPALSEPEAVESAAGAGTSRPAAEAPAPPANAETLEEAASAERTVARETATESQAKEPASRRRTVKPAPEAAEKLLADDADTSGTVDWLDTLEADESLEPDTPEHGRLPRGANTHVFILYVVAQAEEGFSGTDILEILLACDLRFGDMDFFHRHERASGRGPIEFSVANMMKPGVFDIDNMEPLQTRGLMFFVTLPGPSDMLKAFDYMYETVKVVAKSLGGDIQDETRSVITRQSLEHMRQQIRELERRLLVRRN